MQQYVYIDFTQHVHINYVQVLHITNIEHMYMNAHVVIYFSLTINIIKLPSS